MTGPDTDTAMRAVRSIPAQRPPADCACPECHDARARQQAADDWRNLRNAQRTAQQLRDTETEEQQP